VHSPRSGVESDIRISKKLRDVHRNLAPLEQQGKDIRTTNLGSMPTHPRPECKVNEVREGPGWAGGRGECQQRGGEVVPTSLLVRAFGESVLGHSAARVTSRRFDFGPRPDQRQSSIVLDSRQSAMVT